MIEIRIPKEITEYKEKLFFGLTTRKLISLIVAAAICIPLYIFGSEYINEDILSFAIIIIAAPIIAFGWVNYHGMNFETFAKYVLKFYLEPQKRPYKEKNIFYSCREEIINERIALQRAEALKATNGATNKKRKDKRRNV